ncbi:hypothetical protein PG987_009325 [Apiospora arundinis]
MDDEGPIEEHATPSPSPPPEDLRTATEKVNISTPETFASGKFRSGNDAHRTWDDPYRRYLDLSSPRRSRGPEGNIKMNTAKRVWTKLKSYGAPMPVNTLDRDTSNGASSPTSRPIQETTDSPPSKRQRLEQNNHPKNDEDEERRPVPYSNSAFVLRDNIPGATTPQTNEFRGNLSPDAIQPHVTEFERVERLIHPPSPVLGERKIRNGKRQENLVIDLVDDGGSEDPIDLVQPRKKGQPIIESDELAHRFMSKSKGTPKRILANHDSVQTRTAFKVFRKRTRSQSMDELAGDSPTLKKARPINKRIATDLSSSGESQRGHITPG